MTCIDERSRRIIYPHGIDGLSNDDGSFINGHRSWRSADRLLALLVILPTVTRDFVPEVRAGLLKFVWGLRILQGRCVNAKQAFRTGITPGSTPLSVTDIDKAEKLIIEGLSMLEGKLAVRLHAWMSKCLCLCLCPSRNGVSVSVTGTTPIDSQPPVIHCPVHYGQCARIFGILAWFWLMVFERYNKKVKNLVGNKKYPISSLANALLRDTGRFIHTHN